MLDIIILLEKQDRQHFRKMSQLAVGIHPLHISYKTRSSHHRQ